MNSLPRGLPPPNEFSSVCSPPNIEFIDSLILALPTSYIFSANFVISTSAKFENSASILALPPANVVIRSPILPIAVLIPSSLFCIPCIIASIIVLAASITSGRFVLIKVHMFLITPSTISCNVPSAAACLIPLHKDLIILVPASKIFSNIPPSLTIFLTFSSPLITAFSISFIWRADSWATHLIASAGPLLISISTNSLTWSIILINVSWNALSIRIANTSILAENLYILPSKVSINFPEASSSACVLSLPSSKALTIALNSTSEPLRTAPNPWEPQAPAKALIAAFCWPADKVPSFNLSLISISPSTRCPEVIAACACSNPNSLIQLAVFFVGADIFWNKFLRAVPALPLLIALSPTAPNTAISSENGTLSLAAEGPQFSSALANCSTLAPEWLAA